MSTIKNEQISPDLDFHFNKVLKKSLVLVSSLQYWGKNMLEIFVIQHTSIWPNFLLIVLSIEMKYA